MAKDPKTRAVTIPAGEVELAGDLTVPEGAQGMVLFAHGSGSSRHSPRNQFVARQLAEAGLATLLFDLFTLEEEERDRWTGELRFAASASTINVRVSVHVPPPRTASLLGPVPA